MIVVLIYGGIFVGLGLLALLFYTLAVSSRKSYECPQCGEKLRVEHMEASHCNMCGAPLNRNDGGL